MSPPSQSPSSPPTQPSRRLSLGIDPDLHTAGWAVVDSFDLVLLHGTACGPDNWRGFSAGAAVAGHAAATWRELLSLCPHLDVIVVETQRVRYGSQVRPQDIVHLSFAAGALMRAAAEAWPAAGLILPEPHEWKGSIRKAVFTERLKRRFGIAHRSMNVHEVDAVGLAAYGLSRMSRTAVSAPT